MNKVIDVRNLNIAYRTRKGQKTVVHDVTFSLKQGEILALVGGSGCGKTTLCKQITGLSGREVFFKGTVDHRTDRDIAMIFQDPYLSLDPSQSVGKQIEETVLIHLDKYNVDESLHKTKEKKIFARKKSIEFLEHVGIPNPEKRYDDLPLHFSGGMRQRIAIAIALAMEPDVIVADEPTSSLDRENQEQIISLLNDLRARLGTSVIISTHDLGLVENHCDRVIVMKDGRIRDEGAASRIFAEPKNTYTKELLRYTGYRKGTEHTHGDLHFHNGKPHSHEHVTPGINTYTNSHSHGEDEFASSISSDSRLNCIPHLIEVKNISKTYKRSRHNITEVFDNISLNMHKGEMLGLSGRSGVGKTTLAKCITGLEKPDKGEIIYSNALKRKNSIQMIFQDSKSALDPRMTVEESLREAVELKVNGERGKLSISSLMDMVELEHGLLQKRPYEISGGQRQRVAIARAVALDPVLLIADEPISSLDMVISARMIHLIRRIQEEKDLTVLMISHDIPMLMHVSDRIISLD